MGRKRQDITLKEPVRIRQAERKDGNKSLYLDIYVGGKILGHKSSVSTQVYAKVSLEKKVAVVKLVDGVFGSE